MLVLARREGQVLVFSVGGSEVRVNVVKVRRLNGIPEVTLAVEAEGCVKVVREELRVPLIGDSP